MATVTELIGRLKVLPQYLLPQHFLTGIVFRLTRSRRVPWKNLLIRSIIYFYDVDMSIAREPDATKYRSFNDFFTRELTEKARPIAGGHDTIACPVDGSISRIGNIEGETIIQAKGRSYLLQTLLAGESDLTECFQGGLFATLYLSPRDYHRIHMPLQGELDRMIYVPGDLFAVNNASVNSVKNVFARNERVINIFNTAMGRVAVILVGALFVGSMETVWAGQITPTKNRCIQGHQYGKGEVRLDKGQELGRFNMGSTVILVFEPGRIRWSEDLGAGDAITMGQKLARVVD